MVPALIGCRFVRLVPDGLHSKSLNAPRLAALITSHKTALNVHSKCNQCSLKVQTNLSRNALKPCPKPLSHHPPCLLALSPAVIACVRSNVAVHAGCTNGGYFLTSYIYTHLRISPRTEFFSAMKMERNSNRKDAARSLARPEVSAHCP